MASAQGGHSVEGEDELKARRRNQLLDAALELFSDHDLHAVSIDDIARRAGVSKGTVYWYFESKEALVFEVIKRETDRIGLKLQQFASGDSPPLQKLHAIADVGSWLHPSSERFSRLVINLLSKSPKDLSQRILGEVRSNVEQYRNLVADLMQQASGDKGFRGFSHQQLAMLLGACIHGLMIRLQIFPDICEPESMSKLIREVFLKPLADGSHDTAPLGSQS